MSTDYNANPRAPTPLVVTAADTHYFRCLLQLALSLAKTHAPGSIRCIAHDLGLDAGQRRRFARLFPSWELRAFEFSRYPPHVRIRPRLVNTNAWKPVIVRAALAASRGPVLWLDSATVVLAPLHAVFQHIERTGLYTPFGGGSSVAALTHPATLAALDVPDWVGQQRQRASGIFGASPASGPARELVDAWERACLTGDIVIPYGADHHVHRFDQSVLNALLYPLAARARLVLTDDEIDVSSAHPAALYRTRNKVPRWVPLALDSVVRACFAAYRLADVALWRLRQRRGAAPRISS